MGGETNMGAVLLAVSYKPPDQEELVNEACFKLEEISHSEV